MLYVDEKHRNQVEEEQGCVISLFFWIVHFFEITYSLFLTSISGVDFLKKPLAPENELSPPLRTIFVR